MSRNLIGSLCLFVVLPLALGQEAAPTAIEAPAAGSKSVATAASAKKPILNFENADLRVVVQAMAKQAGYSIILPEDVKGSVTARLVDIPIEKALRTILESKGFSLVELDGVYTVKSKGSIDTEPTKTEIYQFANANAGEAKPTIDKLLSGAKGSGTQLDVRSNTLLITDVPSNLVKLMPIIKALDEATPQVMIETKMLETVENPTRTLGVQWPSSLSSTLTPATMSITEDPGNGGVQAEIIRSGTAQIQASSVGFGTVATTIPQIATLSLPSFTATLNALMSDSDTELIASPRIITADNKEAEIKISRQRPIPNFTFNQSTASYVISGFEYKDIGNILKVTPHVNRDNYITMDVRPEVSSSTSNEPFPVTGGSINIPVIDTRTLVSRVLVKSGDTLALGGLLQKDTSQSYRKVPLLGDIPVLGELFTNRTYSKTKRNLLIFITPTVLGENGTGFEDQYNKLKPGDEDDRFSHEKDFFGNAKPRDQFRNVDEPTSSMFGVDFSEKGSSRDGPSEKEDSETPSGSLKLEHRLAPALRE